MIPEEVVFHEASFQRYLFFVAIETLVAVSWRVAPSRRSIMFNIDHSSRLSYGTVRGMIYDLSNRVGMHSVDFSGKLAKCRYFMIHCDREARRL
jgi:hypothetical protein